MAYSLADFCGDVRAILGETNDRHGREQVRRKLEVLLRDPGFRAAYLDAGEDGMTQIYEDPELRFCVLAYNMTAPRNSPPHDHGESWAVYGQAVGYTDMTIYSQPGDGGRIEPTRTYRLEPGRAGLFDVRDIHSISYGEGAKFVRVTGVDMSEEPRRVFDPDTGEVREVESVGTGRA